MDSFYAPKDDYLIYSIQDWICYFNHAFQQNKLDFNPWHSRVILAPCIQRQVVKTFKFFPLNIQDWDFVCCFKNFEVLSFNEIFLKRTLRYLQMKFILSLIDALSLIYIFVWTWFWTFWNGNLKFFLNFQKWSVPNFAWMHLKPWCCKDANDWIDLVSF